MSESQNPNDNCSIAEEGALVHAEKSFQERLPLKLQDMVWKEVARLSINDSQPIRAKLVHEHMNIPSYDRKYRFAYMKSFPAVLHYCSLSRYHGLKVYRTVFAYSVRSVPIYMAPTDYLYLETGMDAAASNAEGSYPHPSTH